MSVERQHRKTGEARHARPSTTRWNAIEMIALMSVVWGLALVAYSVLVRL